MCLKVVTQLSIQVGLPLVLFSFVAPRLCSFVLFIFGYYTNTHIVVVTALLNLFVV